MKQQSKHKLALRKETVRALTKLELEAVDGAGSVIHVSQAPSCRICLTTPAP
jgi:hypothetical protein